MGIVLLNALEELLTSLERFGAKDIAEEVRRVASRGDIADIQVKPHKEERVQQPLNSESAYRLAAEMICAAIDPILMHAEFIEEFSMNYNSPIKLSWNQDLIEGSLVKPEEYELVSFPQIAGKDVQALRTAAQKILQTLNKMDSDK